MHTKPPSILRTLSQLALYAGVLVGLCAAVALLTLNLVFVAVRA